MKTKKITSKYTDQELAESFVFRNELTPKENRESELQLSEMRKKLKATQTPELKTLSSLLQLKFQIEDYLKNPDYDTKLSFGYFLKSYLRSLSKKNKDFASDIDISESELSQILNKHRDPSDKIMIRLEIHSNQTIPAITWYKLLEKEKEYELVNNNTIRVQERGHVKNILSI